MKLIQCAGILLLSASALSAGEVEVYYTGPGLPKEDIDSGELKGYLFNKTLLKKYDIDLKNATGNPVHETPNIQYKSEDKNIGPMRVNVGRDRDQIQLKICPLNGTTNTTGIIPVTRADKALKKITVNLIVQKHEAPHGGHYYYDASCNVDAVYE